MTRREAIAKIVPVVRQNVINNLNGRNNKVIRTRMVGNQKVKVYKYPYPRTRTLLNSIKVVQLKDTIFVSSVYYGSYLDSGTRFIKPARPWFTDAITKGVEDTLTAEMEKALGDEILAMLRS
jgi:hypothetical protein